MMLLVIAPRVACRWLACERRAEPINSKGKHSTRSIASAVRLHHDSRIGQAVLLE